MAALPRPGWPARTTRWPSISACATGTAGVARSGSPRSKRPPAAPLPRSAGSAIRFCTPKAAGCTFGTAVACWAVRSITAYRPMAARAGPSRCACKPRHWPISAALSEPPPCRWPMEGWGWRSATTLSASMANGCACRPPARYSTRLACWQRAARCNQPRPPSTNSGRWLCCAMPARCRVQSGWRRRTTAASAGRRAKPSPCPIRTLPSPCCA